MEKLQLKIIGIGLITTLVFSGWIEDFAKKRPGSGRRGLLTSYILFEDTQ